MQKICRQMWYDYIAKYEKVYMACNDGMYYYFDQDGTFLTKTYKTPSPGNSKQLQWYEEIYSPKIISETEGIDYTCNVEFTTNGLLYGIAENRWILRPKIENDLLDIHIIYQFDQPIMGTEKCVVEVKFQYFFVPYENE